MSRFEGKDVAAALFWGTEAGRPAITKQFDPYERIREVVTRLCVYSPESDMLVCSVGPQNRMDISMVRRQLMRDHAMTPTQIDNGFCAAYISIEMEQRGFYQEALTGINELEVTEAHDR